MNDVVFVLMFSFDGKVFDKIHEKAVPVTDGPFHKDFIRGLTYGAMVSSKAMAIKLSIKHPHRLDPDVLELMTESFIAIHGSDSRSLKIPTCTFNVKYEYEEFAETILVSRMPTLH